jgi:hypothetical protein
MEKKTTKGKKKGKEKKMLQPSTGKSSETLRNSRCLQRVTRIGSGRASKRAQVQRAKQIAAHTEGERDVRLCFAGQGCAPFVLLLLRIFISTSFDPNQKAHATANFLWPG